MSQRLSQDGPESVKQLTQEHMGGSAFVLGALARSRPSCRLIQPATRLVYSSKAWPCASAEQRPHARRAGHTAGGTAVGGGSARRYLRDGGVERSVARFGPQNSSRRTWRTGHATPPRSLLFSDAPAGAGARAHG